MDTSILIALHLKTIIFYFVVISSSSFCAFMSYKTDKQRRIYINKSWLFVSFGILYFFLAFANCGMDYEAYKEEFLQSSSFSYIFESRLEFGYMFICFIIRLFTDSFETFHAIWALALLLLLFSNLNRYKQYLHPGWVILAFSSTFMIQSLNLMRIYLATMLVFWGWRFLLQNKKGLYVIILIAAIFIHKSSICLAFPFVLSLLFKQKNHYSIKTIVMIVLFGIFYNMRDNLFGREFMGYDYGTTSSTEIGSAAIVYALPVVALFIYCYVIRKLFRNDVNLNLLLFHFATFFIFSIMAYFVNGMNRMGIHATYAFIILPQYLLVRAKNQDSRKFSYSLFSLVFVFYYYLRAYMMISYIESDAVAPYTNVFGLSI